MAVVVTDPGPEWQAPAEVAEALGVPVWLLTQRVRRRGIRHIVTPGRHRRYHRDDVIAMLADRALERTRAAARTREAGQ